MTEQSKLARELRAKLREANVLIAELARKGCDVEVTSNMVQIYGDPEYNQLDVKVGLRL